MPHHEDQIVATVQWAQSEGQVVVVQVVQKDLPGSLSLESSDGQQLRVFVGPFPIGASIQPIVLCKARNGSLIWNWIV